MKHNALMNMVLLRRSKFALKRAEAAVVSLSMSWAVHPQLCVSVLPFPLDATAMLRARCAVNARAFRIRTIGKLFVVTTNIQFQHFIILLYDRSVGNSSPFALCT